MSGPGAQPGRLAGADPRGQPRQAPAGWGRGGDSWGCGVAFSFVCLLVWENWGSFLFVFVFFVFYRTHLLCLLFWQGQTTQRRICFSSACLPQQKKQGDLKRAGQDGTSLVLKENVPHLTRSWGEPVQCYSH